MEERPLECGGCKRECEVSYTELADGKRTSWTMCRECPILKGKVTPDVEIEKEELFCPACGTSFTAVETGGEMGCSTCYTTFEALLLPYLQKVGKSSGAPLEIKPMPELQELHSALHDALEGENYEQAAWLRDQIQTLKEADGNQ